MLIQKLRLQRGWSQQQLAEFSGLSVRTVQRLERGQPGSLESLKALAAVFEIDFATLQPLLEPTMTATPSSEAPPALPIPPSTVSREEARALRQVRHLRGFYVHLGQYVVVVGMLALINVLLTPRYPWVLWVAFGWGIGVLSHALGVFVRFPFLGPDWERRQVEKRLGRRL